MENTGTYILTYTYIMMYIRTHTDVRIHVDNFPCLSGPWSMSEDSEPEPDLSGAFLSRDADVNVSILLSEFSDHSNNAFT